MAGQVVAHIIDGAIQGAQYAAQYGPPAYQTAKELYRSRQQPINQVVKSVGGQNVTNTTRGQMNVTRTRNGYRNGRGGTRRRASSFRAMPSRRAYIGYRPGGFIGMGSIYGGAAKFIDDLDQTGTLVNATWTPVENTVTNIPVASGPNGRSNMCVAVESISVDGFCVKEPSRDNVTGDFLSSQLEHFTGCRYIKFALFIDKQHNKAGTIPAASVYATNTANYAYHSPKNLDNRKRFSTIATWEVKLEDPRLQIGESVATAGDSRLYMGRSQAPFKYFHKFKKPLKVEFDPASPNGTPTDTTDNLIVLWACAMTHSGTADDNIEIFWNIRCRYRDCE